LVNCENDEQHGIYKQFYDDGNLKLDCNIENDKKDGQEKRYLQNMILEWKDDYNKDWFHNTWTKFNANGN
jgi:antitoxin component YwqK of YwqJK toxin-antitoxin module